MQSNLPFSTYLGRTKQFVKLRLSQPAKLGEGMIGYVLEHPFHPAGTEVSTTPVLSLEGNRAETRSSVYELH